MSVTLCVPPRPGELCVLIHFLLRRDSTTLELTSRHRIDDVIWDADEQTIAVLVEITDPATSRPIDVRIHVLPEREPKPRGRTRLIGQVQRHGESLCVYGTYLGVVADEN
jgi:hypothetical protein